MNSHLNHGRAAARHIAAALGFTALLAAGPASAWEYPLLPHVNGLAFFPETPSTEYRTTALLSAVYPNECWRLVDTLFVDSAHVRVTIRRATDCSDTLSYWMHSFDLGYLAAGMHELTVHCTVLDDGVPPVEEEITVPVEVVQAAPPPPPPPVSALPLLEIIEVHPQHPAPGDPVMIRLRGFKPFTCTLIHEEAVVDQHNIQARFTQQESCADTTQRWTRDFAMGSYPEGDQRVDIRLYMLFGPDSASVLEYAALFRVGNPVTPPPIDSTTLLNAIQIEPASPKVGDPVTVHATGRYPFECGVVQDVLNEGGRLVVTLASDSGCTDTSRTWAASWALGTPPAGDHSRELDVQVSVGGIVTSHYYPVAFRVTDPDAPPPPPVDSSKTGLSPGRPNPFRDETLFAVTLEEKENVEVAVFDLLGRRVNTIHRGELPKGTSTLAWNGRRSDGSRAPGGIYFYQLKRPSQVINRRVVLLATP